MAEASVASVPPLHQSGKALRLVLFGMPDAGKSSLLGALLQTAKTQEAALKGQVIDESQGLAELHQRLYADTGQRTESEVLAYPITFEPDGDAGDGLPNRPIQAVLYDCNGREANQFLSQHKSLLASDSQSQLARAVLKADTLLLVVDAASGSSTVKRDFAQFRKFLRILEESRSHHSAVNGLPVYLVLTKCDLLASKTDSLATWMERIEEHKGKVDNWFRESLKKQSKDEARPFGKIDLHVWATAIKRPPLRNQDEGPREPYKVGELFRQCLVSAQRYRQAEQSAQRILHRILGTLVLAVAFMVLLALIFVFWQTGQQSTFLETRIQTYKASNEELPGVLYGNVPKEIRQLENFQENEKFEETSAESQQYVKDTLAKLQAYQEFEKKMGLIRDPRHAILLSELHNVEANLIKTAPPDKYAQEWVDYTPAGRRRAEWLKDAFHLNQHAKKAEETYKGLYKRWEDNVKYEDSKSTAAAEDKKLQNEAQKLLYQDSNKDVPLPGRPELKVADVLRIHEVREAYSQWKSRKPVK
jgi:GTPase SAR1 family protein